MHIHIKSIFDSLNETLDKYRPYGLIGEPFPWKSYARPAPITNEIFHVIMPDIIEFIEQNILISFW